MNYSLLKENVVGDRMLNESPCIYYIIPIMIDLILYCYNVSALYIDSTK